ncbi:teichuronic acid biosynthesis glycosyltransferase TuaG [Geomicrobium halophilum]|uniref:Teichuronic acid biosynthesis glycosyltransferase TuaG n=1 Tax=Geomicrobium halophilum TaxID=549000 RepID=A0A841PZ82_9BACL|nr:glycosyltransferase family 2 protein [Geomicrobium halophilum]MBB6449892.1 teichuronic acid biosynthesis glycosyltransferase TuaG [Geomicrobium halophilum]
MAIKEDISSEDEALVSIITPTYNSADFIQETINSVLNQTYQKWELIIVDDCSTDNTLSLIQSYNDARISYYKLKRNSGAAVARNTAIQYSQGDFLAFLDSDDLWEENKLKEQIQFMKENDVGFTFTGYRIIKEDGNSTYNYVKPPSVIAYKDLLKNTAIGCLTVMIDKNKIPDIKMPDVRAGQDTACWLSILKQGHKAYGINQELAYYRNVDNSISSNKFKALKRVWKIYRDLEGLNIFKSSWYFSHYVKNALLKRI